MSLLFCLLREPLITIRLIKVWLRWKDLNLRDQVMGLRWNRTPVYTASWSGWQDLNLRPLASEARTLARLSYILLLKKKW